MRTVDINQTELVGLSLYYHRPAWVSKMEAASDAVVRVRTSILPK
jgi:hypothetical protein